MTSPDAVIAVSHVGKCYELFDKPHQRLLSFFFSGASRRRKEFWALRDINFTLRAGETLGVIGRNGSGKSTLLQIICGTLTASDGEVTNRGRVAALLELGAGFNPEFTGRENVLLNASIYGLTREQTLARLDNIIAFSEIGDFIDQPVQNYSSGMFVRLAFAVIAHVDADILVIDEALAVGDVLFAQKCIRFLEDFRKRGSVIFVSHDSGAVTRLCDRALWLKNGEQAMLGGAKEVSEAYLEYLYGEQQEVSQVVAARDMMPASTDEEWHDARTEALRSSNLRNDLEVHAFDFSGEGFGTGKAAILDVCFRDGEGRRLSHLLGGAKTQLEIRFSVTEEIPRIIVGFLVKNRLGQVLFGDNNYLFHRDDPVTVTPAKTYSARFGLTMPFLPAGEYVVTVAVASGTQQEHVQHCWRHDALVFSALESHVVHGLMGVPVGYCDIAPVEV